MRKREIADAMSLILSLLTPLSSPLSPLGSLTAHFSSFDVLSSFFSFLFSPLSAHPLALR